MGKIHVMDHPLIAHKISYIRRADVGTKEFREVINEIAQLMCYEATRDLKLKDVKIRTPIAETVGKELAGRKPAIIPILRAGVGMVDVSYAGCEGGAHWPVPGSGDAGTGGILLQTPVRL